MDTALLIVQFAISLAGAANVISLHGNVTVGGLFPFTKSVNGACGSQPNYVAIQEAETVKWVLNILNKGNYIKDVTIGR